MAVAHDESYALHLDWWGKCRTCKFWSGGTRERKHVRRALGLEVRDAGICNAQGGRFFSLMTDSDGYCPRWDSFDPDVALELLYDEDAGTVKTHY